MKMRNKNQSLLVIVVSLRILLGQVGHGHAEAITPNGDRITAQDYKPHIEPDLFNEYQPEFWDSQTGLPFNKITAMHLDQDGYLWLGGYFGIARFNGENFVPFDPYNIRVIKSDTISGILPDKDPRYFWISTSDGLYRSDGRKFEDYKLPEGSEIILSMSRTDDGTLWLATLDGLVKVPQDSSPVPFRDIPGLERSPLHLQHVRVHNDHELITFGPGSVSLFNTQSEQFETLPWSGLPETIKTASGGIIPADSQGYIWCQTETTGIFRLRPGSAPESIVKQETGPNSDVLLLDEIEGDIWLSGENGRVTRFRDGVGQYIDLNPRFGVTLVDTIYHPKNSDNYWLGAEEGLILLKRRAVKNYSTLNGLPDQYVLCIAQLDRTRFVIGTGNGPAILDKETEEIEPFAMNVRDLNIRSVCRHPEGGFWISNEHWGPLWIDRDHEVHFSPAHEIWRSDFENSGSRVSVMLYDSHGNFWIGTKFGAVMVRPDESFQVFSKNFQTPIQIEDVRVIFEHKNGPIWMGTHGDGLAILDGDTFETFGSTNGLSGDEVFAIAADPDGDTIWLATDKGITRYRDGVFKALRREDGVPPGTINQILFDTTGEMWITSLRGVHRISTPELNACIDGELDALEFLTVDTSEGMLNSETNGEFQPAGIRDWDGELWIPTIKALSRINPSTFLDVPLPRPPIIEEIRVEGRRAGSSDFQERIVYDNSSTNFNRSDLRTPLVLAPGQGEVVTFELGAPHANLTHAVQYRARFGSEKDGAWRQLDGSVATYTTLKPGTYIFEAQVSILKKEWSDLTSPFQVRQLPHFYQTWYFYALVIVLALIAALLLHTRRMRYASRIQQLEQDGVLISERERIARDMHDDLGSRLTHISLIAEISERENSPLTSEQLQDLNSAVKQATRAVEEIVWAVKPENDTSEGTIDYLIQYAEHQLEMAEIACRNNTTSELPNVHLSPELRHTVFLTFKEAINNVIKHAKASEVWLTVIPAEDDILIRVADNGIGFEPEDHGAGNHNGLRNMANRMADIEGIFSIRSTVGKGTRVDISFSLPKMGDTQLFGK